MTPTQPTATTTEVSEAMVSAARNVIWGKDSSHPSGDELIRAALEAALSTAPGMVLVPREPSEAMLHAAINAIPMDKYIDVGARRSKVTLSTDECATIYRAMLSAASPTGKETP